MYKKLAVNKAWLSLKNNLTKDEQDALIAWRQAIDRMPKSAKSVNHRRFKRMAQEQMEACKSAIPCWIMPIHQIITTFKPKAELFDIVIIDEASQLGLEALFLFYFAKKIIIVGDDKQTAPENIGINQDNINGLINQHLKGISFSDYYSTQFSFF
jgi:superfamily I DNA and/or RNA helicase